MKKLTALFSMLCLTLALAVPASALEYDINGPGDPSMAKIPPSRSSTPLTAGP